jgi:Oxysterol-binding protein
MADAAPDGDVFYDAAEPVGDAAPRRPRPRPRPRLAQTRSTPTNGAAAPVPKANRAVSAAAASSPRAPVPGAAAVSIPRRYVVPHDIFYADKAPDAEISIVKIAREAILGLKQGADITNVNLPASVLDPVSSLEKGMKSMQRGELMPLMVREADAKQRFMRVLTFYFSGLSKEKFGKKPYNPILGEVFRAAFLHREEAGETVLVAEQVSHHPPVTALHLWNRELQFRMNSYALPEPRFWGNSVEVKLKGHIRLCLDRWDEEYEATRPSMHMSGFLAGRHRIEFVGPSEIRCLKSGYAAELDFKSKGLLGRGEMNGVSGRVYVIASGETVCTLAGTWDGVIKTTQGGKESILFDYERIVADYSMCAILPPEEEREPTFSSVVWAECSKWIWKADTPNANAAKRLVEDTQRQMRREHAESGGPWAPTYFERLDDGRDGYRLREHLRPHVVPEIELGDEALKIISLTQKFEPPAQNGGAPVADGKSGRKKLLGRRKA